MPVYKDNRNNSYYFKVCINGRQFLRRGFISKKEARNEEVKFLASNGATKKTTALLYCELLDSYKTYLKDDLKFTTYKDYCRSIDNYYKFLFPNIDIRKLTPSDVVKVRKKIDKENISSSSKNTRRTFLFRFFKYVKLFYDYDFYYIERMKKFRDDTIKKSSFKNDLLEHRDFISIYKTCDSSFYRLAFLTFYLYGLRLGELLALKVDAFDFENGNFEIFREVSFKTGTGGYVIVKPKTSTSQRFYFMSDKYSEILKTFITEHKLKPNDFVFYQYAKNKKSAPCPEQTFRRQANAYCREYNENFHFHMLRKSTVTKLHDKSIHLEDIKKYVGHTSSDITKNVYLQQSKEKINAILKILDETIENIE